MSAPQQIQPRRILVREMNWLGDAVMTTPALLRLRERFPEAHITLLAPEKLRDLWLAAPKQGESGLHHPAVNETIAFAPDENVFSVGKKLRSGKFDLALVLRIHPAPPSKPGWPEFRQRIGCARPWRNFFLTDVVPARAEAVTMRKRSVAEIQRLVAADVNRRVTSNSRVLTTQPQARINP